MRWRLLVAVAAALSAALVVVGTVYAQGFAVNEHDACAVGRGGATVARPCAGGPAIWFNPAALASEQGTHVKLGAILIAPSGGFTDDRFGQKTELDDVLALVPYVYFSRGLREGLAVGISVTVPYGLETRWPTDFEGRFAGYRSKLQSVYIQPTVAYDILGLLSVGAGLDVVVSTVRLRQRVDLAAASVSPGVTFANLGIPQFTDFADAKLEADGTGLGFNVGAQVKFWETLTLGVRYLHRVKIDYDGDAEFTQLNTGIVLPANNPIDAVTNQPVPLDPLLAAQFGPGGALASGGARTSVTMPNQWMVGFAWDAAHRFTLLADYQRINWSHFDVVEVDFDQPATPDVTLIENYRDSHGFRVGGEYLLSPAATVRAGYLWHSAAAPAATVTPLLPEARRWEFTGGATVRLTPRLQADVAYQYLQQQDRRGRLVEPPAGVNGATLNSGLYQFHAHLVGASVTYTF